MTCAHMEFQCEVRVGRIEDVGRFVAEVRINCIECGIPFQFMGIEPGFNYEGPTVSLDGFEANLPIHPQGVRPNPLQKLMGYTLKASN